ncbi:MAG: HAD-IA family hydrolase [Pikeienuella sp.]
MPKTELLILDCDGVLIDSEIIACQAEARALSKIGFAINAATVAQRYSGQTSAIMYATIEKEIGHPLPPGLPERVMQDILAAYRTDLMPIDGAAEFLSALEIPKCVASSSSPSKLALGLVETHLFDLLYPHIFSAHLVPRGKPFPDIFNYAADQMGFDKSTCLIVEDSAAGVQAAKAAGIRCIGFTGGSHCPPEHDDVLLEAGAEAVVSELNQVYAYLR